MMTMKVQTLCAQLQLKCLMGEELSLEEEELTIGHASLPMAGVFQGFDAKPVILLTKEDFAYTSRLPADECARRAEELFRRGVKVLIGLPSVPRAILQAANTCSAAVLVGDVEESVFFTRFQQVVEQYNARRQVIHGVLMDVGGMGVLLQGEAGIGKSETALRLIRRGHRLIADDAVEITCTGKGLIGRAPKTIRYLMGIRGVGLLNIRELYGLQAVREEMPVELIIQLTRKKEDVAYERIGLQEEPTELLSYPLTKVSVPVWAGRDLAEIIEIAVLSFRMAREQSAGSRL